MIQEVKDFRTIAKERLEEKERKKKAQRMMTNMFVGASFIIFTVLFLVWVIRSLPQIDIPNSFKLNAFFAIISSLFLFQAVRRLRLDEIRVATQSVFFAWVFGIIFAIVQVVGWAEIFSNDAVIRNMLLPITAVHFLHMQVGLVLLFWLRNKLKNYQVHSRNMGFLLNVSRFWHFLVVVWIGIIVIL